MLKSAAVSVVVVLCAVAVPCAHATSWDGVEFPQGAASFADAVHAFAPGANTQSPYNNPSASLGPPNYPASGSYVSLGWAGVLEVQFTDNSLTTSGDSALDLWVFEIGSAVESTYVDISRDAVSWISVGQVGGATSGVDIDAYVGSGVVLWERYSFVRLTDNGARLSGAPYAGADIDAVGAISSAPPVLVPEPLTMVCWLGGMLGAGGYLRRRSARRA